MPDKLGSRVCRQQKLQGEFKHPENYIAFRKAEASGMTGRVVNQLKNEPIKAWSASTFVTGDDRTAWAREFASSLQLQREFKTEANYVAYQAAMKRKSRAA